MAYVSRSFSLGRFLRVPKIIALDPSGPFMNLNDSFPLNPTDANIVIAIHSDSWHFGEKIEFF